MRSERLLAFNVAGRNLGRDAADYLTLYCYYLRRRVAARRFLYGQVRYRIGLVDDAVRDAIAELARIAF